MQRIGIDRNRQAVPTVVREIEERIHVAVAAKTVGLDVPLPGGDVPTGQCRLQAACGVDQGPVRELTLNRDADQMRGYLRHREVGGCRVARLTAVHRNAAERLALPAENGRAKARLQAEAQSQLSKLRLPALI